MRDGCRFQSLIFQGVNITHLKRRSHHLPSTFTFLGPTCSFLPFLPGVQLCMVMLWSLSHGFGHPFQVWFQVIEIEASRRMGFWVSPMFCSKFTVFFVVVFDPGFEKKSPKPLKLRSQTFRNLEDDETQILDPNFWLEKKRSVDMFV